MNPMSKIKSAFERSAKAMELKPEMGRVTKQAEARLVNGLACEVREGNWTFTNDMPEGMGGDDTGPGPGTFCRMALGSCLAIGYAQWLSLKDVPYGEINVKVEGDLDFSGILGVDDSIAPGHEELRVSVNIESPAPRAEIERIIELADRHSPVLHLITKPVPVKRELTLTVPAAEPATVAT